MKAKSLNQLLNATEKKPDDIETKKKTSIDALKDALNQFGGRKMSYSKFESLFVPHFKFIIIGVIE